jgi:hypothetical protein
MKIELHEISIREVVQGYVDNAEEGVVGYGGKLNIRPKYQREYVYDAAKRDAVLDTIRKGFPLNVMYWMRNADGSYEMLDGQQRTVSFCQYVNNDFSIDNRAFHNLTKPEQDLILDYKLMIYFCEGDEKERLDWFKIINIAGLKLTDQEMRNAIYTGPWLTHAKSIFSKTNCAAYGLASNYVNGSPIRQEILEVALDWITGGGANQADRIEAYMGAHQHDPNANELWMYFRNVIAWVELTFPVYRREMKGLPWGGLYDQYKDALLDTGKLEQEIKRLMMDDDVTNKRGVYAYVLSRNEKTLNIRSFSETQKRAAYERQNGKCRVCGQHFDFTEMEGDHITPWHLGGKTLPENCQMLCKDCNRRKAGI